MTASRPAIASPLIWSTAASLGTQAMSFITFALLARLLGASAFGLVALAALVIDLLLVVSNAGINEAVIQRPTLDDVDADTAFWANLGCGLTFCIATIVAAPMIAWFFNQPRLIGIIQVLALIFAITPLGAIHTARLTRNLRFRSVATRNLAASLVGAATGLSLAFAGYGAWALVAQRLAVTLVMAIGAWISFPWLPKPRFAWPSFWEMLRFGGYIGLSGTLNQINIRSAELISGTFAGPVAIAFIRAGSRIVEVVNQITYMPFQQIAMPILTRTAEDREAFQETYLRISRLSAFVMFPAFLGCLALARDIVAVVFGPRWEPVADALRIFACAVFASQMNNLIVAAMAAVGQSRTVLSWTATQVAFGLTAAAVVHSWGWQAMLLSGVARGYLILPYGFYLLRRHVGVNFRDVFRSLRPAMISSAIMTTTVLIAASASRVLVPGIVVLAIWIPAGASIYLGSYFLQDRGTFNQMRELALARFRRSNLVRC